mgnify:CR=1 FL=1
MLDAIFGRTKRTPTTTVRTVSKLPEEIAPYVKEVLKEAQEQYAQDIKEPYLPYEGETIAPRDQLELEAIERQKGLVGIQDPRRKEAEEIVRGLPTEFTAETAQKFMSPFQQAVVDLEKQKSMEDFEQRILPAFETEAIGAGGLSGLGSRAGVQAALLGEAQAERLGEIQTRGSQRAYEDALRQFTLAGELGRQRAADLQKFGLDEFNLGLTESGLLQRLGQDERAESQRLLDKEFSDYIEEKEFPKQALAQYSSFVYGNPFLREPDTTRTTTGGGASRGQQLLGAGLTGLGLYGLGGGSLFGGTGFTPKNLFTNLVGRGQPIAGYKSSGGKVVRRSMGGGLSGLPIVRKFRGGIMPYDIYETGGFRGDPNPITNSLENQKLKSANNLQAALLNNTFKGLQTAREQLKKSEDARKAANLELIEAFKPKQKNPFDSLLKIGASISSGKGAVPAIQEEVLGVLKEGDEGKKEIATLKSKIAESDVAAARKAFDVETSTLQAKSKFIKSLKSGQLDDKERAQAVKNWSDSFGFKTFTKSEQQKILATIKDPNLRTAVREIIKKEQTVGSPSRSRADMAKKLRSITEKQ